MADRIKASTISAEDIIPLEDEKASVNSERIPVSKAQQMGIIDSLFNDSALGRTLNTPIPGVGKSPYELLPDFRNDDQKSPVDNTTRAATRGLLDEDPDRQLQYLESRGYSPTQEGTGPVLVNGKPVDPDSLLTTFSSLSELGSEAVENIPFLASLVGKSPGIGMAAGAATGGLKELAASALTGTDFRPENMLDEAGGGLVGGAVDKYGLVKSIPAAAKASFLVAKKGVQKLVGAAKPLADDVIEAGMKQGEKGYTFVKDTPLFKNVKSEITKMFSGNRALGRELGGGAKDFNKLQAETMEDHLDFLLENSPEFVERVVNNPALSTKTDAAIEMYKALQNTIDEGYTASTATVKIDDILANKNFGKLNDLAFDSTQSPKVAQGVKESRRQLFETLYNTVRTNEVLTDESLISAAAKEGFPLEQAAQGMYQPASELSTEALEQFLRGKELPITEAFSVRRNLDSLSKWGADNKDFNAVTASVRNGAGAIRQSIRSALEESGDVELLQASDSFHHLIPIVHTIVNNEAAKGGIPPTISRMFAGTLNSNARRAAIMAQRAATSPMTRGMIRKGADKLQGVSMDAVSSPGVRSGVGGVMDTMGKVNSAAAYGITENAIDGGEGTPQIPNLTQMPQPTLLEQAIPTMEDFQSILPQVEPTPIARDPEVVGTKPEDMELIANAVSPATAAMFQDAVESEDPFKKRMATVAVMEEAPEIFEKGIYGLRSAIAEGDHYVIGNYQEAQNYRKTVRMLLNKGAISRKFYAKQISALNDPNDLKVFVRPDVKSKTHTSDYKAKESQLESLNNSAKSVSTAAGDRREYDY